MSNNYDFLIEETRHKKRSKKRKPKKSDHKHEYERYGWCESFSGLLNSNSGLKYWVTLKERCKICGKENNESKILSEEEFLIIQNSLEKVNKWI